MHRFVIWILLVFGVTGCSTVEVGVSNPIPGLSRVAIAPFFNLSTEPTADGHRFAEAYFTELQRTPGFEVVPIGVTEAAMQDNDLDLNDPDDALKLAKILNVDAVVVGAVTAYDPYYPPRVGLRIAWYSPYPWTFVPGLPIDPRARPPLFPPPIVLPALPGGTGEVCDHPRNGIPTRSFKQRQQDQAEEGIEGENPADLCTIETIRGQSPGDSSGWVAGPEPSFDPRKPLMSYARIFDGADSALTAALRDYVELNGDLRSGGWEAYLHRSDDFLRFTARLMIDEMLMLHGGETRRRAIFACRKQK